jgi:CheY-like chemotaxis protein/two-component sensor histidine kinase
MHRTVVDLNEILSDVHQMLERLIGEDVVFDLDLAPTSVHAHCDPNQIEQILLNLAVNARHAMPQGGTFTIRTEVVRGPSRMAKNPTAADASYALLTISDTGCGMDEETQSRAFDAFFTTKAQGTGLGLWTVRRIAEQNGGYCELQSEVGNGTTFRIFLPFVSNYRVRSKPTSSVPPRAENALVLVVDDEPMVRLALEHYLTQGGYRVLSAGDGPTALAIVRGRAEPISAIVTDVVLPGIPGPEILQQVRRLMPCVGALFLSAHSPDDLLGQGRIDGSVRVLQKPVDVERLLTAVAECIAEASTPSAADAARVDELSVVSSEETAPFEGRRPVLMLVDDDDTTRETLQELFVAAGYDVVEATSGKEALSIAREYGGIIDVLITDICLDDIDGLDLVERLHPLRPDMAVLYLSGWPSDDPSIRMALQKRTRVSFVPKPIVFDRLLGELRRIITA